jgi:hypothetical protein
VVIAKRETYFLVGIAVLAVVYVLDAYVVEPYLDTAKEIANGQTQLKSDMDDDHEKFMQLKANLPEWNKMLRSGLLDNSELVESQTIGAILAWSNMAGVTVKGTRTGKPAKDGNFVIINYDFNLESNMASLSKLLWALENSPIPLRISDLKIVPVHDGIDDLNASMQIDALSRAPTSNNPAAKPAKPATPPADVHTGA